MIDTIPAGTTIKSAIPVSTTHSTLVSYSNGTSALQASKSAYLSATYSAGTDVDISAVVCVDGTTGLTHVRTLVLVNNSTTVSITVGGSASNAFEYFVGATGDKVQLAPGARLLLECPNDATGWLVDVTHKNLKIAAVTGTAVVEIFALGD
jgi:hypothetical protein